MATQVTLRQNKRGRIRLQVTGDKYPRGSGGVKTLGSCVAPDVPTGQAIAARIREEHHLEKDWTAATPACISAIRKALREAGPHV